MLICCNTSDSCILKKCCLTSNFLYMTACDWKYGLRRPANWGWVLSKSSRRFSIRSGYWRMNSSRRCKYLSLHSWYFLINISTSESSTNRPVRITNGFDSELANLSKVDWQAVKTASVFAGTNITPPGLKKLVSCWRAPFNSWSPFLRVAFPVHEWNEIAIRQLNLKIRGLMSVSWAL